MGTDNERRRTLELDIKGKPYTLTEFSAKDLADFEKHILERRVRQFRELSEGMDEAVRLATMGDMIKAGLPDMQVLDEMNSMLGVLFLLHKSLSYCHPDLTIDEVGLMLDMANATEISVLLQSLGSESGIDESDPLTPPGETGKPLDGESDS